MLILIQTYIPTMYVLIFFNEQLKNNTASALVSIGNILSREFC